MPPQVHYFSALCKRYTHWLILIALLAAALGIRIASPHCFHLPGSDIPQHIAYSMKFDFPDPARPLYRTTINRLLSFNHGYSQAAGMYGLYKTAFDGMGVPINPRTLALIHSLVGIASLLAIFAYIRSQSGFRDAMLITAVLALVPVHVGVSTANSGYQLFKMTGIFMSLWRLDAWQRKPCHWTATLYALSLIFAIGASVDFFFTLLLNVLYAVLKPHAQSSSLKRILFHPLVIGLAWLPVMAIIAWHAYTVSLGFPQGVLSRLEMVTHPAANHLFDPLGVLRNLFLLVGPIALLAPVAMVIPRVWRAGTWAQVAAVQWFFEFLVLSLSGRGSWTSHILNLAAPSLILSWLFLKPFRHGLTVFITGGALSAILSLLIIFRVGSTDIRTTYGSRNYSQTGVETLGFLFRSGILSITNQAGSVKLPLGVDFEGVWFFLGADTLSESNLRAMPQNPHQPLVLIHRPSVDSDFNRCISDRTSGLSPVIEILDGTNILMRIFKIPTDNSPCRRYQSRVGRHQFYSTYTRLTNFNFTFL